MVREETTGYSMRGGGREGGPGPVGCEAEQSGTIGHVKRWGGREKIPHGTEDTGTCTYSLLTDDLCRTHTQGCGHATYVQTGAHTRVH